MTLPSFLSIRPSLILIIAFTGSLTSWKFFDASMVLLGLTAITFPRSTLTYFESALLKPLKVFNYAVLAWLLIVIAGYFSTLPIGEDQIYDLQSFRWIFGFYLIVYAANFITFPPKKMLSIGILSMVLLAAGICWQTYSYFYLPHNSETDIRLMGFFHNTNHYSLTISLLWAFLLGWITSCLNYKKKVDTIILLLFLTVSICLIGSQGRSAWIGCTSAAILMLFLFKTSKAIRRLSLILCISTLGAYYFNIWSFRDRILYSSNLTPQGSSGLRLILWKTNWKIFLDHPLLGVGFYNNIKLLPEYYNKLGFTNIKFYSHAHNQYFQIAAGSGLLGLLSYLLIFGLGIKYFYTKFKKGISFEQKTVGFSALLMIVTFLFESFTECPFNLREPRNLLILLAGCSFVWCEKLNTKEQEKSALPK